MGGRNIHIPSRDTGCFALSRISSSASSLPVADGAPVQEGNKTVDRVGNGAAKMRI